MSRFICVFFILFFVIQHSLANSLNDIDNVNKCKLIEISEEEVIKSLTNLPSRNMLTLQAILKESKVRIKSALPLLLAGVLELYLNIIFNSSLSGKFSVTPDNMYYNEKVEHSVILHYLALFLPIDIILSSSFVISKTVFYNIVDPALMGINFAFSLASYCFLSFYSMALSKYSVTSNLVSLYAVINGFINTKNKIEERGSISERVEDYYNNLDKSSPQIIIDNLFDGVTEMFLYVNSNSKESSFIENFYQWIATHKNDICLHSLTECSYIPNIKDISNRKSANIAKKYHPSAANSKLIYSVDHKLSFNLTIQNKKLTNEIIAKSIQSQGIKLIEVDSIGADKNKYNYIGIINNGKNYYLVIGAELNNQFTEFPKSYREIFWNSIINDNPNFPETSTLVIKVDLTDKISSIVEYLFKYLDFNRHVCVYDVLPE